MCCMLCSRLFARICGLPLSSKKMKFFFKRYLAYEKQHGDATQVEHVKELARTYVQQKMSGQE